MRVFAGVMIAILALAAFWLGAADRAVTPPQAPGPVLAPKTVQPVAFNWNSFRGPNQGVSPLANAPLEWDGASGKGVIWKVPLSQSGVGSPVIWGDKLFLTEGDEHERVVLAFDLNSGKELWRRVVLDGGKGQPMPGFSDSGLALTTPACDAHGVYALFGTGDLAAFSHDGQPLWQIFLKRPVIGYGYSSSPCLLNNFVCVQLDDHTGGKITAVDTTSGKVAWEADRSRGASWSSPLVIPGPGPDRKPVVVVNANGSVSAYDDAGKMVWDADGVTGEVTPSPAYWDGKLYPVHNGSGLLCYDVTGEPKKLFEYHGTLCDVASPVIAGGLLFMASGGGELCCVDALTGKEQWTHECPGCYASLVSSGNRVYCLGRDGTTLIVAAERQFRSMGSNKLSEGSDSTPALGGDGRIYIRTRKTLWCLGQK